MLYQIQPLLQRCSGIVAISLISRSHRQSMSSPEVDLDVMLMEGQQEPPGYIRGWLIRCSRSAFRLDFVPKETHAYPPRTVHEINSGYEHQRQRKHIQPAFSKRFIRSIAPTVNRVALEVEVFHACLSVSVLGLTLESYIFSLSMSYEGKRKKSPWKSIYRIT